MFYFNSSLNANCCRCSNLIYCHFYSFIKWNHIKGIVFAKKFNNRCNKIYHAFSFRFGWAWTSSCSKIIHKLNAWQFNSNVLMKKQQLEYSLAILTRTEIQLKTISIFKVVAMVLIHGRIRKLRRINILQELLKWYIGLKI